MFTFQIPFIPVYPSTFLYSPFSITTSGQMAAGSNGQLLRIGDYGELGGVRTQSLSLSDEWSGFGNADQGGGRMALL